jgi:hypothetical protein
MANIPYKLADGRIVRIPQEEINRNMVLLKLSKDEAIQMYLEDEGYMENPEQEALEAKAKENRITATIHKAKTEYKQKTQRERVVKDHPVKEEIIATLAASLEAIGATQIEVVNKQKTITFMGKDGEPYAIDLKWERNKAKAMKSGA